jgi:hypothetical protein
MTFRRGMTFRRAMALGRAVALRRGGVSGHASPSYYLI